MRPASLRVLVPAALVAALLVALPAAGQQPSLEDEPWHPQWGDWSLSFFLPDGGGGGFGLWKQYRPNTALGLTVNGRYARSTVDTPTGDLTGIHLAAAIGPALKRYWWRDGPVAPFLHSGLQGSYAVTDGGGGRVWTMGGGLTFGVGADWFPTEGISIGGHAGIQGSYSWATNDAPGSSDQSRWALDLFTSALTLQIYF